MIEQLHTDRPNKNMRPVRRPVLGRAAIERVAGQFDVDPGAISLGGFHEIDRTRTLLIPDRKNPGQTEVARVTLDGDVLRVDHRAF